MRKFFLPFICSITLLSACSHPIDPVGQKIGKLNILIDPRIELLTTIQALSDYEYINRNSAYGKEMSDYFKPYALNDAVIMTDKLERNNNFKYASPVQFMLGFSSLPDLKRNSDYSQELLKRGGGKGNLESYKASIKEFAKKSDFKKFWESNEDLYNKIVDLTISDLQGVDLVKIIEDYFNQKQNSYNIIISTLSNRSYSYKQPVSGDNADVYSCNAPRDFKDGIPYIKKEVLIRNASHEFSHSFVDYLTVKYEKRISESELIYGPIQVPMNQQGYGTWGTCVNEHIVRAINIRLHQLNWGDEMWREMLKEEKANQFIYIEQILNKLKEFESSRSKSNISFTEFYPKFLDLFDSLKIVNQKSIDSIYLSVRNEKSGDILIRPGISNTKNTFTGPIDAVFKQKLAWIYPTSDSKKNISSIQEYVSFIFKKFKKKDGILIPDTVALKTDLSGYGLMVYGTIESNLFLSKYKSLLPFQVKGNTISADKEYSGEDTRLISCMQNPQNPQNGMVVHTAVSNKYVCDINNVNHGDEDFIIFKNRKEIYSRGYYIKSDKWEFNRK